jgi:phage gpG-like protein
MGLETGISIEDTLSSALQQMELRAADENLLLAGIGQSLSALVRKQFETSTDPYGRPWEPLKSRDGKPLYNTGGLANSVRFTVGRDSVEVGVGFPWIRTHQFGATIYPKRASRLRFLIRGKTVFARKVTIPTRPVLPLQGLPNSWKAAIENEAARIIQGGSRWSLSGIIRRLSSLFSRR